MIIIADNDVIYKLACCDLLLELIAWLQAPPAEIWVLPGLPFVVRKKLKGNHNALACFNSFMQKTQLIPAANLETLKQFAMLDVGEQQLFAVFVEQNNPARLVTGDKRAIKLVAELTTKNTELNRRLNGRVDCLESVMLGLIEQFGFDSINTKITQGIEADGVFKLAFGAERTHAHAVEALTSFLEALRQTAPFVVRNGSDLHNRII